ncbi:MAG: energy transducer TonB [Flavipsychrobacter sp.]
MTAAPEQNINIKALAWTIGVHAALLLLFFLWRYTLPVTVTPPEMGMEVNLGTSDNGSSTDQPMAIDQPAPDEAAAARQAAAQQSEQTKDMLQGNDNDAPAVNTAATKSNIRNNTETDNNRHKVAEQTVSNDHKQQHQRPKFVYTGGTGRGGNGAMQNMNGSSEGNTTGSGDRGVPNGTPGASNYVGSPGNGNGGISHTLTNRNIVAFPGRDASFREQGRVVIRVTVNRDGEIVNKQVISASSAELRALALRKVDKVRFNKSESAPEEQFGNITFVFKTRS